MPIQSLSLVQLKILSNTSSLSSSSLAPPRALDADDLKYYESLSEIKQKEMISRKENENKEVELFKQAQHRQDSGGEHHTTALFQSKNEDRSKKAANAPKIGLIEFFQPNSLP
jgi:hypothetical protein